MSRVPLGFRRYLALLVDRGLVLGLEGDVVRAMAEARGAVPRVAPASFAEDYVSVRSKCAIECNFNEITWYKKVHRDTLNCNGVFSASAGLIPHEAVPDRLDHVRALRDAAAISTHGLSTARRTASISPRPRFKISDQKRRQDVS